MPNRLANSSSPYLRQHADNPVDWYPWGEEAFRKAKREDKPIFLSVGYSSCHWCHVMEKESFRDPEIARILNENFVPVKVDREEMPDVDDAYQKFVQAVYGHGGWPLSVFLTPDGVPFAGGTYFPPFEFKRLLLRVAKLWREDREKLKRYGQELVLELKSAFSPKKTGKADMSFVHTAFGQFMSSFDDIDGGFHNAPKFPRPFEELFLFRYWKVTGNQKALDMALFTLRKMCLGGIFDHVGGGFHRYSTDSRWLVPHFEKMLYDNAQLLEVLAEAFWITRDGFFRRFAQKTFEFLERELSDPRGGFYSSTDADSEGEEGKYFVWTWQELGEILKDELDDFAKVFKVKREGNWEDGKNVIAMRDPAKLRIDENEFWRKVEGWLEKLRRAREKRVPPATDNKVIVEWNGLAIKALARAGLIFSDKKYIDRAEKCASFVVKNLVDEEGDIRARTWTDGDLSGHPSLADYVFLSSGLFELFISTQNTSWLEMSEKIAKRAILKFKDEDGAFFDYKLKVNGKEIFKGKDIWDGSTPSANAELCNLLLKLSYILADTELGRIAEETLDFFAGQVSKNPFAYPTYLIALLLQNEISAVTYCGKSVLEKIIENYLPFTLLLDAKVKVKFNEGKDCSKAIAWVCKRETCFSPAQNLAELSEQIKKL